MSKPELDDLTGTGMKYLRDWKCKCGSRELELVTAPVLVWYPVVKWDTEYYPDYGDPHIESWDDSQEHWLICAKCGERVSEYLELDINDRIQVREGEL